MNDDPKIEPEQEGPPEPERPRAEWQYKTEFGINSHMREIIGMSIKVAEAEIETYRRKIDKLTYGS